MSSSPLGNSFRIEDIIASGQGKYLAVQKMWWDNYAKMPPTAPVGGQQTDKFFVTMSKCDPLFYDGVSKGYSVPTFTKAKF